MMFFLRQAAYSIAIYLCWLELVVIAYNLQRKFLPMFGAGKDDKINKAPALKDIDKALAARKQSLFMDYETYHPNYRWLYFVYCPLKWLFLGLDWYRLQPIWQGLSRYEKVEMETFTKSRYMKRLKVIVGGRIRYLGHIGSKEKLDVWFQQFFLRFIREALFVFPTENLYIFDWRV